MTKPVWLSLLPPDGLISKVFQRMGMCDNSHHNLNKVDWLTLFFITFATLIFHWRGLQPGYAFLPIDNVNNNLPWRDGPFVLGDLQNQLIGDPIYQFYPFLVSSLESVRQGEWPLWNSHLLLGHPSFADPLFQTFYPVFLILGLVFSPARALTIGFVLHTLFASWFTYGWLRSLNKSPSASAIGALTYALGGYMVTWFETTFWVSTLAWLPAVLFLYELGIKKQSWLFIGLAALALGLATLAGQLSFVLIFCAFFGCYVVTRAIDATRAGTSWGWQWAVSAGAIVVVLGLLLGAIQILPFIEFLRLSHRAEGSLFTPISLQQLITLIVPNFYGNPATTGAYWGWGNFSEGVLYVGVVYWFLILVGLFTVRRWKYFLWCGLGLICLYLAYGGPGVSVSGNIPILNSLSLHRFVFIIPLILAMPVAEVIDESNLHPVTLGVGAILIISLGAIAFTSNWGDAQAHLAQLRTPLGLAGLWLILGVGLLTFRQFQTRFRFTTNWAIVGLVFADLYTFGAGFNPALPVSSLPPVAPVIEHLQQTNTGYRIASRQVSGEIIFGPNFLLPYHLPEMQGYSSLLPARLLQLIKVGDPNSGGYNGNTIWLSQPSQRLLDLLHVKQVVSTVSWAPTDIRAESNSSGCQQQTAELTQANSIIGQLTVRDIAINRLDLTFRLNPQIAKTASLTIRMWQGLERQRLMLENQIEFVPAQVLQTATFYFSPEQNAPGQSYLWELSTTASETGLSVCATTKDEPEFTVYGNDWSETYNDKLIITERLAPLPRAFVVYQTELVEEGSATIERLLSTDFDPRNTAIVNSPSAPSFTSKAVATPAEINSYNPTHLVINVSTQQAGLLVLGDYNYPGWEAWVNGQRAEVITANLLWRGVVLPAGQNQIEFRFNSSSLWQGLILSSLAFAIILSAMAYPYIHKWSSRLTMSKFTEH